MAYLFLDTFALSQLTDTHFDALSRFIEKSDLILIISTLQLMEDHSPVLELDDRTHRAVRLLSERSFVIADVQDLFTNEEKLYPATLTELPVRVRSESLFQTNNALEKKVVLFKMFHYGIPEAGFDLIEWSARNNTEKTAWPDHVAAIMRHADEQNLLKSKAKFLESHDLRFCWQIIDAIEKLGKPGLQDGAFKRSIRKLTQMQERKDTWRMRGIHLTSLLFWYDYIIAKKKIKPSDEGDLMHAFFFPYCKYVVTDKSRVDCLEKIQKKELRYNVFKNS